MIGGEGGNYIERIGWAAGACRWLILSAYRILRPRLRRVAVHLYRNRADKVIAVELEEQPQRIERGRGAVEVDGRYARGVRRHGQNVSVAQHLVEDQSVGERLLQVHAAAETAAKVGVLIDRKKDLLFCHYREA